MEDLQLIKPLAPEEQAAVEQEATQDAQGELKYGDKPLEAGALGAARGATFGISDQMLTSKKLGNLLGQDGELYTPEALNEIKERNKISSTLGEVGGVAATLPLSSSPAGALARVGSHIELKTLGKILAATGNESIAKQVLKKGIAAAAGSSVEGSFYGLGQLISENALGQADANAENVVASLGSGAILGGALGGAMGVAGPIISKIKMPSLFTSSEPEKDALKIMGITTPAKTAKMFDKNAQQVKDLPEFIANDLKYTPKMNYEDKYNRLVDFKSDVANNIKTTINAVDEKIAQDPFLSTTMPTQREFATDMSKLVESYAKKFDIGPTMDIHNGVMRLAKNFEKDAMRTGADTKVMSFNDINDYRLAADSQSKWSMDNTQNELAKANRYVREQLRTYMDGLADKAGPELGSTLKALNKKYSMASTFENDLQKVVYKDAKGGTHSSFGTGAVAGVIAHEIGLGPVVSGIAAAAPKVSQFLDSNYLRTFKVLNYVEKSNQSAEKTIQNSIKNFITKNKEKIEPLSTSTLLQTSLASPDLTKKPKVETKDQAYNQIKGNMDALHSDPSKYMETLTAAVKDLQEAAPNTHIGAVGVLERAQQFLKLKMPQELKAKGVLDKSTYKPNSVELAKFGRYVEAVEHPLTAIKQIQNGIFSPETAEALRVVYPNLFTRLQSSFMDAITSKDLKLDYKQKILISNVLKIPAEGSFNNLKELQATYSAKAAAQQQQQLSKINMNFDNQKSGMERITTRK